MAEKEEEERNSPLPLGNPPLPVSGPSDPSEIPKRVAGLSKAIQVLASQLNESIEGLDRAFSSRSSGEESTGVLSDLIEGLSKEEKEKLANLIREKTKEKLKE